MLHLRAHQRMGIASVQPWSPDRPHLVVRPVHVSLNRVVVDGDCMTYVAHLQDHVSEIREVQRDPAQIGPTGQQQNLLRSWIKRRNIKSIQSDQDLQRITSFTQPTEQVLFLNILMKGGVSTWKSKTVGGVSANREMYQVCDLVFQVKNLCVK